MRNTLHNIGAIAGKELRSSTARPSRWVLMGLFALLFGGFYYVFLDYFLRAGPAIAVRRRAARRT